MGELYKYPNRKGMIQMRNDGQGAITKPLEVLALPSWSTNVSAPGLLTNLKRVLDSICTLRRAELSTPLRARIKLRSPWEAFYSYRPFQFSVMGYLPT